MDKHEICVVGPNRLQNELMAFFITEISKFSCNVSPSIGDIPACRVPEQRRLILFDCCGDRCDSNTITELRDGYPRDYLALFNLKINSGVELHALQKGVSGILYENESIPSLVKMTEAIFDNEVWMSRRVDPDSFNSKGPNDALPSEEAAMLTNREIEVLSYISKGFRNVEIAEKTFTSTHTVKTHVYNIFKKIGVNNRLQAARWAVSNL